MYQETKKIMCNAKMGKDEKIGRQETVELTQALRRAILAARFALVNAEGMNLVRQVVFVDTEDFNSPE